MVLKKLEWPQDVIIYGIENIPTSDMYVGSTKQLLKDRQSQHLKELYKGKHHSILLQRSWDKYGEKCFIFKLLDQKVCNSKFERALFETFYVDKFGTLNSMPVDIDKSNFTMSDSAREKVRLTLKENYANNPEIAKNHSNFMAEYYKDPENRKKTGEGSKRSWKNESKYKSRCYNMSLGWDKPGRREKKSIQSKAYGLKRHAEHPEIMASMLAGSIKNWGDPVTKESRVNKYTASRRTPESRAKSSNSNYSRWRDPVKKEDWINKRNATRLRNKNLKILANCKAMLTACLEEVKSPGP